MLVSYMFYEYGACFLAVLPDSGVKLETLATLRVQSQSQIDGIEIFIIFRRSYPPVIGSAK